MEKTTTLAVVWTLRHEDKSHSCISKRVKTFISGTPEPLAVRFNNEQFGQRKLFFLFFEVGSSEWM